ncbi:metal-dependent hydrolase [Vibrio parahaemolyticus]|nr:metal-dependent hydrolase [Vibrio parahaemolyticus]
MRVTGHIAVGAASYLYTATFLPEHSVFNNGPIIWFAGLFLTLFGALLPDADCPESTVGKKILIISYPLSLVFGHRGITHSLWAIFAMLWLGYYFYGISFNSELAIIPCIALGYLSHLFADSLTPQGIRPFYPSRKRFCIPIVQNGLIEFVLYVLILSSAVWAYFKLGPGAAIDSVSGYGFR